MTPPIFSVIDGIQREITSIPITIDGVQRELGSMTAMIDGVEREVFSSVKYTWEKYTIKKVFVPTGETTSLSVSGTYSVKIYNGSTPDSGTTDGKFSAVQAGNYIIHQNETYLVTNVSNLFTNYILKVETVTTRSGKGDLIETVTSNKADTYPNNGEQDGYWYVKI